MSKKGEIKLISGVESVSPSKKNTYTGRGEKSKRTFFQAWVKTYFDFCEEKFGEKPSFDGSAPRDLGNIYDAVEKKCFEKEIQWTEEISLRSLKVFLEYAWNDDWLQQNFMLFNLNRQKDKIFFKIKSVINGKAGSEKSGRVNSDGKPFSTSDSKMAALKKWGVATIIRNQREENS